MLGFYFAGLLLFLMPCTSFLIPVILLRITAGRLNVWSFAISFLVSFLVLGWLLSFIGNNPIGVGLKLALSSFFIGVSVVSIVKSVNVGAFVRAESDVLMGLIVPFVVLLSPCGLPVFGAILVGNATFIKVLVFSLGAATPFVALYLLGNTGMKFLKSITKITYLLEKLTPLLLLFTGIYGFLSVKLFVRSDIYIFAGVGLLIMVIILLLMRSKKPYWFRLFLFSLALVIWLGVAFYCHSMAWHRLHTLSCNAGPVCPYCTLCYLLFMVVSILSGVLYLWAL